MMAAAQYHLGFGPDDLGDEPPTVALVSGDPERTDQIAERHLDGAVPLSRRRGLHSWRGRHEGRPLLAATSGMGAPSLSIVVNELVQLGVTTIIRVGTSGGIQPHVEGGDLVITSGALTRQGAARDIAPSGYPAVADPFLVVALAEAARDLGLRHHVGITASVDTFYEGQGRVGGANPHLLPHLAGLVDVYRHLNVLNFEMEAGTLLTMAGAYGFRAACVCAVIASRAASEEVDTDVKADGVDAAVRVALAAAERAARAGI
ncbi:MAG: nucleoside phosphorylase [Acidimicrobiales bacterium]